MGTSICRFYAITQAESLEKHIFMLKSAANEFHNVIQSFDLFQHRKNIAVLIFVSV